MKIIKGINKYICMTLSFFLVAFIGKAKDDGLGVPSEWGIDLQNPITEVAKDVYDMHFFVLIIVTLINPEFDEFDVFVMIPLIFVISTFLIINTITINFEFDKFAIFIILPSIFIILLFTIFDKMTIISKFDIFVNIE